MLVVGQKKMFEIQILVLVVVLVRVQTQAKKLDSTGELSSFSGGIISNIMKHNIKNELDEQDSNIQPFYSPEEYDTFMKEFEEEDTKEIIHNFDKLENKQKTTEKENPVSKKHETRNSQENSFPEILIMSFIGIFIFFILLLLCLGSNNCVKRFITGRQRLKKAIQYRPSKHRTRVTPIPGDNNENGDDAMKTTIQGIFQIA